MNHEISNLDKLMNINYEMCIGYHLFIPTLSIRVDAPNIGTIETIDPISDTFGVGKAWQKTQMSGEFYSFGLVYVCLFGHMLEFHIFEMSQGDHS